MPPPRPGNQRDSMRPDIQMARNESGIDLSDNFANPSAPERSETRNERTYDISHLLSGLKKTTIGKATDLIHLRKWLTMITTAHY